jgi:hypothetical protein
MAELVPHPLVTRVGIGLTGQTWLTLPPDASGAADDLGAEVTTAADAAKLAAQNAAAQATWAAAVIAAQAAQEASDRADQALKQAQKDARGPDPSPEVLAQRDVLAQEAKQAQDDAEAAKKAADDAQKAAKNAAALPAPQQGGAFDPIDIDDVRRDQKQQLAAALADNADLPDLSLFAGFLGGQVTRDDGNPWRLVYLDSRLYSWMLVQESDILVHQRLADDHAPSGLRDVLWVRGTANVVQGSGAQSTAGRFLVGEFTRAGDFAASTSGGTFSAATGLLCEATTPGCCMKPRTR